MVHWLHNNKVNGLPVPPLPWPYPFTTAQHYYRTILRGELPTWNAFDAFLRQSVSCYVRLYDVNVLPSTSSNLWFMVNLRRGSVMKWPLRNFGRKHAQLKAECLDVVQGLVKIERVQKNVGQQKENVSKISWGFATLHSVKNDENVDFRILYLQYVRVRLMQFTKIFI